MSGINKVIILGRLGKDPEARYTAAGKAVVSFSLATSYGKGDAEVTEWHRCVAWEKTGEVVAQFAKKGNRLYVEGELTTRKWQDKDGQDRYTTEINVRKVELLDRNEDASQAAPRATQKQATIAGVADMEDDIPF